MKIQVCCGKACKSNFSEYIIKRLENDKEFYKLKNLFVEKCPCTGNCKQGPSLIVDGDMVTRSNPAIASAFATGKKRANQNKDKRKRESFKDRQKNDSKNTKK